jgi:non-specific serine/threonine protein kinase
MATRFVRADRARLLTLTGPGGVGKTRLAMALREELRDAFPGGTFVVELDGVTDEALVPPAIAHALGAVPQAGESEIAAIARHLGDRDALLVVDNAEHVTVAADIVATILEICPGLTVLATSRSPLRIRGEQELPLAPLALPGADRSLAALAANPAVTLFLHHARAVLPGFELTVDNADTVAAIVARLDGLPLAIELAAARMRLLPPSALLQRLDQRLPILTGGARDLPERLRTVRAAIAWSHELLGPEARALFRRLAVFAGGFSLEAAEALQARIAAELAGAETDASVLDGLGILLDHALIMRAPDAGDARFGMLGTVREFGLGELAASQEAELAHAAHARVFLDLAERAEMGLDGPDQARWIDRLALEHDNLRAALTFLFEHDRADEALRLSTTLWPYWSRRGHLLEGRGWLERALALGTGSPPERRAKAALRLGNLALDLADLDRAEAMYTACLDARREMGEAAGVASSLAALGLVALHRGDIAGAEALLGDARARFDHLDDAGARARIRFTLGRVALAAGETARARSLFEDAAAIRRDLDDANGLAYTMLYLAEVALAESQPDTAEHLLDDARDRFEAQGDCIGTAWATHDLAAVALRRGDLPGAEARYREALTARLEHADRQGVAETLEALAGVAAGAGKPEVGARLFASADAWREVTGLARMPAEREAADRLLASIARALGADALAAVTTTGRLTSLEQVAKDALAADPFVTVAPTPGEARDYGLTPREREVLRLLAEGRSDREIADALFMAPRTVSWHVGHILAKFDVESRTAAASLAVREGLA